MTRIIKIFKTTGIVLCSLLIISFLFILINSKLGNSKIQAGIDGLGTKLLIVNSNSIDRTEYRWKFAFSFNDIINIKISLHKTSGIAISPVIETINRKVFRSKTISFYLAPDSGVIIKGKSSDLSIDYDIIKGNMLSFQYNELRKEMLPYFEKESVLWSESYKLRKRDPEKSSRIEAQFDSLRFYVVAPLRTEWAKKHLDYELTPLYLLEGHVPQDTVRKYLNLLSINAREYEYGQILEGIVAGWANAQKGNSAPHFSQYTNLNELFDIAQLKGKYSVLDFWGSWCGPCISGFPKMKEYYQKYNTKLEFVGIACNDKKDDWEKAIKENQLNWIHILNDKSINDISVLYGISSYPTKFIIDKEGKIIEKFVGEKDDFYDMIDKIMQQE